MLSHLTALENLELNYCALPEPATLGAMQGLAALALNVCPRLEEDGLESLAPALAALQDQLTKLSLYNAFHLETFPQELAGCSRLQRLAWNSEEPAAPALLPGPWLGSLRRLVLPAATVLESMQLLQEATPQLETLGVTGLQDNQAAHIAALELAAAHPRLRRLLTDAEQLEPAVRAAAAAAQQQKPGLEVVAAIYADWDELVTTAVLGVEA